MNNEEILRILCAWIGVEGNPAPKSMHFSASTFFAAWESEVVRFLLDREGNDFHWFVYEMSNSKGRSKVVISSLSQFYELLEQIKSWTNSPN